MSERPHGFRSSLRTWLADCTEAPEEVAETILSHSPGNKVVKAYRRTDFFAQRAILMRDGLIMSPALTIYNASFQ